jgi:phosphate transport system permease protein
MSVQEVASSQAELEERVSVLRRLARRLALRNAIAMGVLWVIRVLVGILFIYIIIRLLVEGAPTLVTASFYGTSQAGIAPELFNTFYILLLTELILYPIALGAAIYLTEYSPQGRLVTVIHFAAETLAGVPSLVLGMFGFLVFAVYGHLGTSRLAGALTLLCLNFPLALRLLEQALTTVPNDLREGGLALGSTRWHMIRTVVVPSALPGLITGLILTAGKIIGEAAALIFTMGLFNPSNVFSLNPLIASDTLTTRLYYIKGPGAGTLGLTSPQESALAAGLAAVLIILLLVINLSARAIGRAIQRRVTAA